MVVFTHSTLAKGNAVLMVVDTKEWWTPNIKITEESDLPDKLHPQLDWKDLNMLIYPGKEHNRMFHFGPQGHFTKKDTLFYLRAFFNSEERKKPLFLHLSESNINPKKKKKKPSNIIQFKESNIIKFTKYGKEID